MVERYQAMPHVHHLKSQQPDRLVCPCNNVCLGWTVLPLSAHDQLLSVQPANCPSLVESSQHRVPARQVRKLDFIPNALPANIALLHWNVFHSTRSHELLGLSVYRRIFLTSPPTTHSFSTLSTAMMTSISSVTSISTSSSLHAATRAKLPSRVK